MVVIIQIIAGPGAGKTTVAALLFAKMKLCNPTLRIEYVQEYAKKLVWRRDFEALNDQYQVSRKQYMLFDAMKDEVDVIITDTSLLIGLYHNRHSKETGFP